MLKYQSLPFLKNKHAHNFLNSDETLCVNSRAQNQQAKKFCSNNKISKILVFLLFTLTISILKLAFNKRQMIIASLNKIFLSLILKIASEQLISNYIIENKEKFLHLRLLNTKENFRVIKMTSIMLTKPVNFLLKNIWR